MGRSRKNERLMAIRDNVSTWPKDAVLKQQNFLDLIDALLPRSRPTVAEASEIISARAASMKTAAAPPAAKK